ncbi:sigma-70 family RNA polymerase sigma factor [Cereibacter sphaeroides]|nr:sigma-70 family RNA polymerase sigma factor [Cereibacter sphaeroides]RAZ83233.1 RNA polymerase sigma factor [Cereibacter johrii]RDS95037.1 RNA polymerase subunit sigma [Cereibacter sphaeroides f. sp. denitrificans]RIA00864.1 sigma-70 family RNA polymerase sigma factor [Cereibacter sphaeroides]
MISENEVVKSQGEPPVTDQTPPRSIIPDVVDLIPALRAYARSLSRNQSDADDLVQETLLKAIANVDKFQPGTRLRAWLFTILRNTFYTRIRVSARERTGAADCVSGEMSVQPSQEWTVRGRELMAAIDRLPPHYREILILVVMLGESYEEAARICDCAIGTVKSRVSRARQLVMNDLEGTGEA